MQERSDLQPAGGDADARALNAPTCPWSTNEWDPLREIIVGSAANARFPHRDRSSHNTEFAGKPVSAMPEGRFAEWVIEEAQQDLALLSETLEALGVKVRRPDDWPHERTLSNQLWQAAGFYNYCPRDVLLVVGDMIVETPNAMRGRYHETFAYRDLLLEYFEAGARWIGAPKPVLRDEVFDVPADRPVPRNLEPIFDAANILRFDEDIVYLLSSTGNEMGAKWLQTILGDNYRIHVCEFDYYGSHIDTSIMPLRPGLLLCNPERVTRGMLPDFLRTWKLLLCPDPAPRPACPPGYEETCLASRWMGMNVLSVRPDLVIVDQDEPALIAVIEDHGIDTIPLPMRHARMLGGGFHCTTVDVLRKAER